MMQALLPVVYALRGLPLPVTHPSHPAANAIQNTLREAQNGYAEMRGSWGKRCLELRSRQIISQLEASTNQDGASGELALGQDVGQWVESLLALAEAEHETFQQLALLPHQGTALEASFSYFCAPLLSMFSSTLSTVQTAVKKNLLSHVWLALQLWTSLTQLQPVWDDVMRARAGRKENELSEVAHAIRGVCLRSFPEFILEVRQAGLPGPKVTEIGTGVAEVTKTVSDDSEEEYGRPAEIC